MQEFSAPRKAITTHVKAYNNVIMCVWYCESAADSSLVFPLSLFSHTDEWIAKASPFSIHGHLLMLPNYDCKNIENFVSRTDNDVHNFLEGGTNKIRKKKEVLAVESDNRGLEDLPQAYLTGCSKSFLLSVRK